MDRALIDAFREKVNDRDLVLHLYHNRDGKDQWSIICSAMDWIDVVIEEIDVNKLTRKNDNASSIKVMTFINCIDILWEAVQQLHRVFYGTSKIPFYDDSTSFSNKLFPSCDNEYFKTIRACFSAHPVNLNDRFDGDKKQHRYASWSGGGFGHGDFSVILYSNQVGYNSIFLDIEFSELMLFAEKRYKHLQTIMDEIDKQIDEYMDKERSKKIDRSENPVEQIQILIDENKHRFDNDYYDYELQKLNKIFSVEVKDSQNARVVNSYRKVLLPVICELYENIQSMKIDELSTMELTGTPCPSDCHYAFSKLSDSVYGNNTPFLVGLDKLNDHLHGIVNLYDCVSCDELYVVVLAGFYVRANSCN